MKNKNIYFLIYKKYKIYLVMLTRFLAHDEWCQKLRKPIVENKRYNQFYCGSVPLSGNDLRPLRVFIDEYT